MARLPWLTPPPLQPLSKDAKELLGTMIEPVSKFFEETNDAAKNDETAEVPPEVGWQLSNGACCFPTPTPSCHCPSLFHYCVACRAVNVLHINFVVLHVFLFGSR